MVGTRVCWPIVLLMLLAEALVAQSEQVAGDRFDEFIQSLSACKVHTWGDGERLACITAEVDPVYAK